MQTIIEARGFDRKSRALPNSGFSPNASIKDWETDIQVISTYGFIVALFPEIAIAGTNAELNIVVWTQWYLHRGGGRTRPGKAKLVLDFPLRPATMTSRQHSGTKLYKDGENSLGDGNTMLRGRGPVWADWFMRWLRCADTIQTADGIAATIGNDVVARLLGEEFTLFAPKSPLTLEEWEHQQMIAETTCRTRENMRMR